MGPQGRRRRAEDRSRRCTTWSTPISRSIPAGVGLSGSAVLPAFFAGKCAMTVQGNYQAQGMIEQSPKGFNWAMFPPLKGTTQQQAANPQTLSISTQSQHKAEAMQFIAYALNTQNMAKLAAGDWLIPASPDAAQDRRQVDEALRQLAERHLRGAGLQEGELGLARSVCSVEGARSRRRRSASTSRTRSSLDELVQDARQRLEPDPRLGTSRPRSGRHRRPGANRPTEEENAHVSGRHVDRPRRGCLAGAADRRRPRRRHRRLGVARDPRPLRRLGRGGRPVDPPPARTC